MSTTRSVIHETGILIDHDFEVVLVDTNSRRIATRLGKCGFRELTTTKSAPYRRFTGLPKQVSFRRVARVVPPNGRSSKFGGKRGIPVGVPEKKGEGHGP